MVAEELVDEGAVGIEEARRFTGLGRTILYDLMGDGTLPFTKIGSRRLIPRRSLKAILAQGVPERTAKSKRRPAKRKGG